MQPKTVLVTGANGYIGSAVAMAFRRAGWTVFGLIRRPDLGSELARLEIRPVIGFPGDPAFSAQLSGAPLDVIVSNTEDLSDPFPHLKQVRSMLDQLTKRKSESGLKPLVMFTSGCKDYGRMTEKHGDIMLSPHTEESPMNPPELLVPRMQFGLSLFQERDAAFDATVLRPTIVYGRSSSLYGSLFDLAAKRRGVLELMADPRTIMHSVHVDDCADAYVALAEHESRSDVAGKPFNISNMHYETAQQIGEALAVSYSLDLQFIAPPVDVPLQDTSSIMNFSQWVSSERLRTLTGWQERRPTFGEGIEEYRMAYEASKQTLSTGTPQSSARHV